MRRGLLSVLVVLLLTVSLAAAADKDKVAIPFDFVSNFDDGRYGEMLGDMIWKKIKREGGFVLPESMLDVRQTCQRNHVRAPPDMPLDGSGDRRGDFGGQIGIWGSVERAPGKTRMSTTW